MTKVEQKAIGMRTSGDGCVLTPRAPDDGNKEGACAGARERALGAGATTLLSESSYMT